MTSETFSYVISLSHNKFLIGQNNVNILFDMFVTAKTPSLPVMTAHPVKDGATSDLNQIDLEIVPARRVQIFNESEVS